MGAMSALDPDLVARLSRMGVTIGVPPAPNARAADLSEPPPASPAVLAIEDAVPGESVANTHGHCYVSTSHRHVQEIHGDEPLAAARAADTASLAALARDGALADLDLGRAAFLDTETTGLMGGTGTYAFLVGVGRFQGEAFQVRQFFMRDPSEERAQLAEVADWVADASGLVTFNGRAFDLPLLRTRYALHRQSLPVAERAHLDLLPAARRLWRKRLDSCSLQSLEYHVFGLERQDDVPGWLIPQRYFNYQRDGDARGLVGIFRHNVTDVLTMVSLTTRLARAYGQPQAALAQGQDWLCLAGQYLAGGHWERAAAACDTALAAGLPPADADEALGLLALAARRAGDWPRALAAWSALADRPRPPRLQPFEELAKYHEHRARAPEQALDVVARARDLVAAGALRPRRGRTQALADLDHRLARLRRKLGAVRPNAE